MKIVGKDDDQEKRFSFRFSELLKMKGCMKPIQVATSCKVYDTKWKHKKTTKTIMSIYEENEIKIIYIQNKN